MVLIRERVLEKGKEHHLAVGTTQIPNQIESLDLGHRQGEGIDLVVQGDSKIRGFECIYAYIYLA